MSEQFDTVCDGIELTQPQEGLGAKVSNEPGNSPVNASPGGGTMCAKSARCWGKCCCCVPTSCCGKRESKIVAVLKVFDAVAKVMLGILTATSGFESRSFFILTLIFRTFFGGFIFFDAVAKCVAYCFEFILPWSGKSCEPPSDSRWPLPVRLLRATCLLVSPILICVPFTKAGVIEAQLRKDVTNLWGSQRLPYPVGVTPSIFAWSIGPLVSLSTIFRRPDETRTYKEITGEKPPLTKLTYGIFDYRNEPFPSKMKLDAYFPQQKSLKPPSGLWPVVVYFHGGGWTYRNRRDIPVGIVDFLLERGVAFVSVEYRLLQHGWNGSHILADAADAMAYLHMNGAKELSVNMNKSVISGNSAGGHLALVTGLTSPKNQMVRGIIDFCGVKPSEKDLNRDYAETSSYYRFTENKRWMKRYFVPTLHVRKTSPPVFMVHGMDDVLVPISVSRHLANVLKNSSVKHQLIAVPGQIHACEIEPFSPCSQYASFGLQSFLANVFDS